MAEITKNVPAVVDIVLPEEEHAGTSFTAVNAKDAPKRGTAKENEGGTPTKAKATPRKRAPAKGKKAATTNVDGDNDGVKDEGTSETAPTTPKKTPRKRAPKLKKEVT